MSGNGGTVAARRTRPDDTRSGETRRVLVFAGGEFAPAVLDGVEVRGAAAVCVDGGLVHCLGAGIAPALLVGDFDSAPSALLERDALAAVPRLAFPADKDMSDLELALHALADGADGVPLALRSPGEVVLVGVSGGRTDHLLFNWQLAGARPWPFELRLLDASVDAVVVTPERPLRSPPLATGRTVSLLPLGRADGVTTGGLRYRLAGATLEPGGTLGLSNVADGQPLSVEIRCGVVLVMRCWER